MEAEEPESDLKIVSSNSARDNEGEWNASLLNQKVMVVLNPTTSTEYATMHEYVHC